jgi:hypothetical protein
MEPLKKGIGLVKTACFRDQKAEVQTKAAQKILDKSTPS